MSVCQKCSYSFQGLTSYRLLKECPGCQIPLEHVSADLGELASMEQRLGSEELLVLVQVRQGEQKTCVSVAKPTPDWVVYRCGDKTSKHRSSGVALPSPHFLKRRSAKIASELNLTTASVDKLPLTEPRLKLEDYAKERYLRARNTAEGTKIGVIFLYSDTDRLLHLDVSAHGDLRTHECLRSDLNLSGQSLDSVFNGNLTLLAGEKVDCEKHLDMLGLKTASLAAFRKLCNFLKLTN